MGLIRFVPVPYSMRFVAFGFFIMVFVTYLVCHMKRCVILWGLLHFLGLSHYGVCYNMWFVTYYRDCLSLIGFVAVLNSYFTICAGMKQTWYST